MLQRLYSSSKLMEHEVSRPDFEVKELREKFETIADIRKLDGLLEDDFIEVKSELIALSSITKKIHSFMNGHRETGFIFLGISEDQKTHKIKVNENFQLSFNSENPAYISDIENVKDKQKNIKIKTIDDYKNRVISYLKSNTNGCSKEHIDQIVKFRKLEAENGSFIIIIEINQSVYRPLQFKQDCKFYMRYRESQSGKGDAESKPMFSEELAEQVQKKYRRMIKLNPEKAIYHNDSIPAIPELSAAFNLIYKGKDKEFLKSLEEFPTIVQMTDSLGNTILDLTLIYKKNELAILLIEKYDMSIYQSNKEGWTPLFSAIYVGNLEAVKFLLSKNKNLIRHRDRLGNNAILLAASYGHKNIIEWFLSDEANFLEQHELQLNSCNNENWNTLFEAVYSNEFDMMQFLFSKDPNLLTGVDIHGNNVIDVARHYNCSKQLIEFLQASSSVKPLQSDVPADKSISYYTDSLSAKEQELRCLISKKYNSQLYKRGLFFTPSQYATEKQPYGPYSDRICIRDDPAISEVMIFNNSFKKLQEKIYQIVENNVENDKLSLQNQEIDDNIVSILAEILSLERNAHIGRLDLKFNNIGNAGAMKLAELSLKELDLSVNNIGFTGAESLSRSKIYFLNLSANPIGYKGAKFFMKSDNIKELSLSECDIGDAGAKEVLKNIHFTKLDLSANNITDSGINEIPRDSILIELNLSQNEITKDGALFISNHQSLETVFLGSNMLGDDGASEFAKKSKIKILDLSQNDITEIGFLNLCKNKSIQKLCLFNNQISFSTDNRLCLPENNSFTNINLADNEIDDSCEKILADLVSIPKLTELNLSRNNISDKGANILEKNKSYSLKRVDLTKNPIKDLQLVAKMFFLETDFREKISC